MPRSSTAQLSAETVNELENQFYTFLDSLSFEEKKKFFSEFLTVEEKMMMYKRLALYWCLLEGYSLAKIQQMIGVTHDTTRVYNKKKNTLSEDFKSLVRRISNNSFVGSTNSQSAQPEVQHEKAQTEENTKEWKQPQEIHTEEVTTQQSQNGQHDEFRIETREERDYESTAPAHNKPEESEQMESSTHQQPEESEQMENVEQKEHQQQVNEQSTPIMHSFDDQIQSHTDTSEIQQNQSSDQNNHSSDQQEEKTNDENEPQEEKKKSGIAKFFGF